MLGSVSVNDFVNGMLETVEFFDARSQGLRVITATNHRVTVFPWTDTDLGDSLHPTGTRCGPIEDMSI